MSNESPDGVDKKHQDFLDANLIESVKFYSVQAANKWLSRGANIHCRSEFIDTDFEGHQPIHIAARDCKLDMLKFLINNGADITAKAPDADTGEEKTALEMARETFAIRKWPRYTEVIALLEAEEAKLAAKQPQKCGEQPLPQPINQSEGYGCRQ